MKFVPQKYDYYLAYDVLHNVKDSCGYGVDEFIAERIDEILKYLLTKINSKERPETVYMVFSDDDKELLESLILSPVK